MAPPDRRPLCIATCILAATLIGLPWAMGGRSAVGQVSLVLSMVLATALCLISGDHAAPPRPSPLLLAAAALAGISAVFTIYPDRTVQSLLMLFAYLLAGTLAAQGRRKIPWAERVLLAAILLSGVLSTALGVFRLLQGSQLGLYATLPTGPFGYPNAFAGFSLLTGGAALAIWRGERNRAIRAGAVAGGLLICCGLWLTRSRAALLAGILAFGLWLAIERLSWLRRRSLWCLAGALCAVAGLIALVWSSDYTGLATWWRLGDPAQDSSLLWRWHILRWTWAMVQDHPWWGVGPGAFPVALTHYQRLPYVSGENPHNLYLELAAEYGLPAGILAVLALGGLFVRLGDLIKRAEPGHLVRGRQAALLATLTAFSVHSLVDLDWSFPCIALTAATMFGLAASPLEGARRARPAHSGIWRVTFIVALAAAGLISLTRYYAATLVTWGHDALIAEETTAAQRHLQWALRLNPVSFPAHQWMAWASLRSGNSEGAMAVADRASRIAPLDPNSQFLAGEIAASVGQWRDAAARFRTAAEWAPSAQFRFHASLIEATVYGGNAAEAQLQYERATRIFTPERVVAEDGRCLAPGDRYLLARVSRVVARSHAEAGDSNRSEALLARAARLAQPDRRGICITRGRPGQTSPEAAMESFWRALGEGGWSRAAPFLTPGSRGRQDQIAGEQWGTGGNLPPMRVAWIARLTGGEFAARLRFELQTEDASGNQIARCAFGDTRLVGANWFVDRLPSVENRPCQP